ncbi:MAG: N-formylglutamate amidohydrolase [Candidatus Cloacimonetes bacterium]|nr:N-formylglutamate amidohydrolase [Candidatus Cloacimonadota bacterium]
MHKADFIFDYSTPLVCTAIHHGHYLRPEIADSMILSDADRKREEDPYTGFFTAFCPNRIIVQTSRFEVDLNRPHTRAIYQNPEDCWGLTLRDKPLTENEIANSLLEYDDFYRRVKMQFDELLSKFGRLIVLDLHSYNHHRLGPHAEFDDPKFNPEIILGTNNMPDENLPFVDGLRDSITKQSFEDRSIDCRINIKFPGGHFSRWIHHIYGEKATAVAIEFKKTFMDEWSGELDFIKQQELRNLLIKGLSATLD